MPVPLGSRSPDDDPVLWFFQKIADHGWHCTSRGALYVEGKKVLWENIRQDPEQAFAELLDSIEVQGVQTVLSSETDPTWSRVGSYRGDGRWTDTLYDSGGRHIADKSG